MDLRRVTIALSLAGLASLATAAEGPDSKALPDQTKGIFRGAFKAVKFDVSPPLSVMAAAAAAAPMSVVKREDDNELWGTERPYGPQDVDMSVQTKVGTGSEIPGPNISFDGFSNACGCTPPDSDGDVGTNHYVIMVNLHFAIYDKGGTQLQAPLPNNTLWAGFGGPCQTTNAGDPIVLHDQLADRWVFTQFTNPGPPFFNCLAVSQTANPMGPYFRYQIPVPSNVLPDYPKWGVWPEAYYLSTREVNAGIIGAYAIDRAAVVAGNPAAQIISFAAPVGGQPNGGDGLLPSDLDGSTLPPAGSPNFFVGTMDNGGPYGAPQDAITFWRFTANFTNPPASTFTLTNTLPVDPFDSIFPCVPAGSRNCIPQPGTAQRLDILSYRQRPTFRLAYRNFGTHESLVTNQSVEGAPGIAGVRWYEIRNPNSPTPVIFQQGTFVPGVTDGIHRWMGSIAMDRAGNMALGYSVSDGTSTFPGIRYTGRLVSDPPGQMPQGEGVIVNGIGSQLSTGARWGDYTAMTVDSVDDCTFWYINEYYPATSNNAWRMRVGQFQFPPPQCIPVPVALQGFQIE